METIIEDYQPSNLEGLEGRCNNILHNCKHPMCDYHYTDLETMTCPECGTPREKCSQYPAKGRDKCRFHGGHSPTGLAHPNHKGRGLSKSVPAKFLDRYEAHFQDPNILDMTDDIALLKMRRDSLLEQLAEQSVSPKQWEQLREKFEGLSRAIDLGHENKINEMLWALGKIISQGYNSVLIWEELRSTIEEGRRVKDSELKRLKIAHSVITEQHFDRTLGFIISVIKNRVHDTSTFNAIMRDLESLNV